MQCTLGLENGQEGPNVIRKPKESRESGAAAGLQLLKWIWDASKV